VAPVETLQPLESERITDVDFVRSLGGRVSEVDGMVTFESPAGRRPWCRLTVINRNGHPVATLYGLQNREPVAVEIPAPRDRPGLRNLVSALRLGRDSL
jgi:hypothetical protein